MANDLFRSFDLDMQRLLVAGSGSSSGDEGLMRAKDGFDKLAAKVPALASASEQIGKVLGARGRAISSELLNLGVMNLKLRAAQAKPLAVEGALEPLPAAAKLGTDMPHHDLERLHRALTHTHDLNNRKIKRRQAVDDAIERGVVSDLRLLDAWVRALGDASLGDVVAEGVIPKLGEAAAARIELLFNPAGKSVDARRLQCLVAVRGEAARPLVERCLQDEPRPAPAPAPEAPAAKGKRAKKTEATPRAVSVEVRAAAVRALERVAPRDAETRARTLYNSEKNQEVRAACVEVMGSGESAESLEILLTALRDSGEVNEAAVSALQRFRHPDTTARVLALLTPELLTFKPYKAPRAKPNQKITKAQQQANQKAEQSANRELSDRAELVVRIIEVLGDRASDAVLDRLIPIFRDHPREDVRIAAGKALRGSDQKRALEVLIERLGDDDYETESLAVSSFFHLDLTTVFDRIQPYFTEQALAAKKGSAIASKLLQEVSGEGYYIDSRFDDDDEEEEEEEEKKDEEIQVQGLEGDTSDEDARAEAAAREQKLTKYPFRRDPRWGTMAKRLLAQKDLAGSAAIILGNLRDKSAIPALFELLRKNTAASDVTEALLAMGDRAVIPPLVELLSLKGPRSYVISALGQLHATEAVDKLCELLTKDDDNNYQLFDALSRIKDQRAAVPIARTLLSKSVHNYPYQAIRALRELDDPASAPLVQEAVKKAKKSKNTWLVSQYEDLATYLERDRT